MAPNLWAVHNDEKLWPEPHKFDPERHLDNEGNFVRSPYIIPFGLGARQCLGEQMARMEVFTFLVTLVQHFKFDPDPNDNSLPDIESGSNGLAFVAKHFNIVANEA